MGSWVHPFLSQENLVGAGPSLDIPGPVSCFMDSHDGTARQAMPSLTLEGQLQTALPQG